MKVPHGLKILVIRHGAFGDLVQALAPMAAIRAHHAGAHLVALTGTPFAPLLLRSGWFQEVWTDDRPPPWRPDRAASLILRLRRAGFDRVYDLQTSSRTAWYFRLLGPRRPDWSGVAPGCSHPHDNPGRIAMHTVDRQAEQLRLAGIAAVPAPDLSWLDDDVSDLGLPRRFALLIPGGSAHRPAKRWPAARYAALARALAARGLTPVVAGGADERDLAATICAAEPSTLDLTGRTSLLALAGIARRAALAVGNDTGPMHLAAALGTPSLALFSAESDPARCAPRGARAAHLRRPVLADLEIAPVMERIAGLLDAGLPGTGLLDTGEAD